MGMSVFMPIISSEKDSEMFFSKLSGTELLMEYLNNFLLLKILF